MMTVINDNSNIHTGKIKELQYIFLQWSLAYFFLASLEIQEEETERAESMTLPCDHPCSCKHFKGRAWFGSPSIYVRKWPLSLSGLCRIHLLLTFWTLRSHSKNKFNSPFLQNSFKNREISRYSEFFFFFYKWSTLILINCSSWSRILVTTSCQSLPVACSALTGTIFLYRKVQKSRQNCCNL